MGEVGQLNPGGSMTVTFLCYHQGLLGTGGDTELLSQGGGAGLLLVWGYRLLLDLLQLGHSRGPHSGEAWGRPSSMVSSPGAEVLCGV